ncbi:hypothetical protein ACWDR0_14975 [Streptomyces sp. NPDC003691]
MSGHDLPAAVLLPAFAVAAVTGWLAGARRRGPLAIGTGLLAAQGALHYLYAGAQGHSTTPSGGHGPGYGTGTGTAMGTASTGTAPGTTPTGGLAGTGLPENLLTGGTGMLVAHVLAAAVCALWLARGEKAFFELARACAALAFTPLRLLLASPDTPRTPRRPAVSRTTSPARAGAAVLLGHTLVRRGPPRPPYRHRATAPGAAV